MLSSHKNVQVLGEGLAPAVNKNPRQILRSIGVGFIVLDKFEFICLFTHSDC